MVLAKVFQLQNFLVDTICLFNLSISGFEKNIIDKTKL